MIRMIAGVAIAVLLGVAGLFGRAAAQSDDSVVGVWKPTAFEAVETESGARSRPYGDALTGRFYLVPNGVFDISLRSEQRGIIAVHAGNYRVEGDKIHFTYQASSLEGWAGTTKTFTFAVAGKTLTFTSPPIVSPRTGKEVVFTTTLERIE